MMSEDNTQPTGWQIALLGASSELGVALLDLLQQRDFPVKQLYLLDDDLPSDEQKGDNKEDDEEIAGCTMRFRGHSIKVQKARQFDWSQAQLAFFMVGAEISAHYAQQAGDDGCLVIDSSGLFSLEADVPLVAPRFNPQALAEYRNRNIVAVAHCLTCQLLTAIKPLLEQSGLSRLHVTNLLSVSAYGKQAIDELAGQSARLLNGMPIDQGVFNRQVAFNMLPRLADEQGSVAEERQLIDEVRKILQDPGLPIAASCILSPVFYGHAQVVQFEGLRPLLAEEALELLQQDQQIKLSATGEYPTQVEDASDSDQLSLGCVRNDYGIPDIVHFWSVADNIRFGGALMALETAERLLEEYY